MGSQSWSLIKFAGIKPDEVESWITSSIFSSPVFKDFIQRIECRTDCAERNIKLIQEFIMGYKNEDMAQNLMLVARDS